MAIAGAGLAGCADLSGIGAGGYGLAIAKRLVGRTLHATKAVITNLCNALVGDFPLAPCATLKTVAVALGGVLDAGLAAIVAIATAGIGTATRGTTTYG